MGQSTAHLLVRISIARLFSFLLVTLLTCAQAQAAPVDATAYDSFWLWSGVRSQPVLAKAKTIYILQGQIEAKPTIRMIAQRPAAPHIKTAAVWIVYRAETLQWPARIFQQIEFHLKNWQLAGNTVVGLQIDFDAKTRHLDDYANFLNHLRRRLPPELKLSITGLLDWSTTAEPKALNALAGTVDEIIIQTYQGHHTIKNYGRYLEKLESLKIPFRIGLIQGGQWQAPAKLARNPHFKGYVIFLQNLD